MPKNYRISKSVIRRLPRYYRFLDELLSDGMTRISSGELAKRMNVTASQIRQDLNCFGGFGMQGYGYTVSELREAIGNILGVNESHGALLIGAGNLGRALAVHLDYAKYGCRLCGIFDSDPLLAGKELAGLKIMPVSELADFCGKAAPEIAILCIPKNAAAEIAVTLSGLGIRAFWNFSHCDIGLLPELNGAVVENVHLGDSLMALSYQLNQMHNS